MAAERATAEDIASLTAAYAEMQAADPAGDAAIDADLRFHRQVLACTHNELLVQMGSVIGVGLLVSFRISSESYGASLPRHGDVLAAIRARDAAGARKAMERLLKGTRESIVRELAEGA